MFERHQRSDGAAGFPPDSHGERFSSDLLRNIRQGHPEDEQWQRTQPGAGSQDQPPPPAPPHAHTANKYQDRREATLPPSDGCLPKSDRQALLITYSIDQAQVNRGLVGHLRGQTPEAICSLFGTLIANCGTDEKHRACCEIAFVRS